MANLIVVKGQKTVKTTKSDLSNGVPVVFTGLIDDYEEDSNYWAIKPSLIKSICNKENSEISKKEALEVIEKLQEWGFKPQTFVENKYVNKFTINGENEDYKLESAALDPEIVSFWEEQPDLYENVIELRFE
jgi:hypothetical protein